MHTTLAKIQVPQDENDTLLSVTRYAVITRNDDDNTLVVSEVVYSTKDHAIITDKDGNPHTVKSVIPIKGRITDSHKPKIADALKHFFPAGEQARAVTEENWHSILMAGVVHPLRVVKAAKNFKLDYLEAADEFLTEQPLWYDPNLNWWVYSHEKSCWERVDETTIMISIDAVLNIDDTTSGDVQNRILRALQRRSRLRAPKPVPGTWVQFKDTLFDIETGETRKAGPEWFCTNPIPWDLGETEDTPVIDSLFKDWVGEKEAPVLNEILAFCCVPSYFIHRIFALVGSGSNGKSTFQHVIRNFVGEENYCRAELDRISNERFESAKLFKKLVCVIGETNFEDIRNTNMLKSLSGDDPVSIEFKGKDPFTAVNYAKIIVATNTLPISHDMTDGYVRRWQVIDFCRQFSEKRNVLAEIPDVEYRNLARKASTIMRRLWKEREFTNQGSIEDRRRRYEEKSNPLKLFIKEQTVVNPNAHIFSFEFREVFNKYCQDRGLRLWNERVVGKWMSEMGYERNKVSAGDDKYYWAYLGIQWTPSKGQGQMTIDQSRANFGQKHPEIPIIPNIPSNSQSLHEATFPDWKSLGIMGMMGIITPKDVLGIIEKNVPQETKVDDLLAHFGNHASVLPILQEMMLRGDIVETRHGFVLPIH